MYLVKWPLFNHQNRSDDGSLSSHLCHAKLSTHHCNITMNFTMNFITISSPYPMIIPWLSHDYPISQPFPTFPNLSPPPQAPLSACSSARCCSRFRASLRKVSWPLQRRCSSCFTCSWRPKNRWRFTDFVDDVQSRKNLKQNITSSYTMLYMMLYMMLYHVLYMLYW